MRISDWSSDVCSSDLIGNLDLTRSGGREAGVVAAFPVAPGDQIMLVTDAGKLIRSPVDDIRIAGRTTRGVTLFRIDDSQRHISDHNQAEEQAAEAGDADASAADTHAPHGAAPRDGTTEAR